MSKKQKSVWVGKGKACPKCRKHMERFKHPPEWEPRSDQPYWFSYWDICTSCRHIQHYEAAKVYSKPIDEVEERLQAIQEQLGEPPW